MEQFHSLLRRQLRRHGLSVDGLAPEWREFIAAVDDAYRQFDDDRGMLERSLDLSSQELLQANAEMHALFQAIPDLLFRLDVNGRIIECRGGLDGSFFVQPRQLIGKRFQDVPNKDLGQKLADIMGRVHQVNTVLSLEYSLPMPNGEHFYEARFIPLRNGETIAIVRDISQRKAAEEELFRSRYMLQLVLDNVPQRVFWKDSASCYLGCNRPLALDAGLSKPEEIVGRNDFELSWVRNAPAYRADDREVMSTGQKKINFEEPQNRPDGELFWLRTSKIPLVDQRGEIFGVLGTYEDITEEKHREAALRLSEERYRIATEATGQIIYDLDTQTGKVSWAGAIEPLTGFSPEELQRMDVSSLEAMVHPEDRENARRVIHAAIADDTGFNVGCRVRRRNGSYLHVEVTGAFVRGENGQPRRALGAMKDVSERIQAQEERERAEEQLRQAAKMEAIGRLAGGVAHDFNNILTGISGYTELLLSSIAAEDPVAADLAQIKMAADRAASLTAQLLAFGRKQLFSPEILDLNELLPQSNKMLRRLIGEDIDFVFVPAKNLGMVKADPGQIEQILINLAVNGRDAMPDGGRLTVETANVVFDEEYCRKHPGAVAGKYVMIAVNDSGCGMKPEVMAHLFEPFFTTKEKGKGTGLGLSMVYGIVAQNNGLVDVYSEVGKGTTFRICLPMVEEWAETATRIVAKELPAGRETILLVEDEEMVRNLVRRILERQGYTALVADSAEKAMFMFEQNPASIDMLLTDVIMPQMDGKQLYERLRQIRPSLKVLYMSGYTEETIAHRGLLESGTHFVQKPFSFERLARSVRQALDQTGAS